MITEKEAREWLDSRHVYLDGDHLDVKHYINLGKEKGFIEPSALEEARKLFKKHDGKLEEDDIKVKDFWFLGKYYEQHIKELEEK